MVTYSLLDHTLSTDIIYINPTTSIAIYSYLSFEIEAEVGNGHMKTMKISNLR